MSSDAEPMPAAGQIELAKPGSRSSMNPRRAAAKYTTTTVGTRHHRLRGEASGTGPAVCSATRSRGVGLASTNVPGAVYRKPAMSKTVLAMIELSSSPRPAAIVACSNCWTIAVTGAGQSCAASVATTLRMSFA